MEMSQSFFQPNQSGSPMPAQSCAVSIYTHPDDVPNDPTLTMAEKRALLASWISDARAVENAPALRRLDSGAVVDIDAILRVLVSLDEVAADRGDDRKQAPPRRRGHRVISRWLNRVAPNSSNDNDNDNDDDPPPAPAGVGIPFRRTFVAAHGARPERLPGCACATGLRRRDTKWRNKSLRAILIRSVELAIDKRPCDNSELIAGIELACALPPWPQTARGPPSLPLDGQLV
jgi:hypothetical protein